jgi:hypothetical protein
MNPTLQASLESSWNYLVTTILTSLALLLPKVVGALTALVIGVMLAKLIRGLVYKILHALSFSKFVNKTPLQVALQQDNLGQRIEENIANFIYWISVLVVIYIIVAILGLSSATLVLEKILGFIPNVISAMFILLFGILVAGWVESLVKGAVRAIDIKASRGLGKISGYFVVVLTSMTALSELGIAQEFLTIMFIGLVTTLALGFGLAMGLGGKNLVEQVLADWYENFSGKRQTKKK